MDIYRESIKNRQVDAVVEWTPLIIVDDMLDNAETTLFDSDSCPVYFENYDGVHGFFDEMPEQYDGHYYYAKEIDHMAGFTQGGQYKIIIQGE